MSLINILAAARHALSNWRQRQRAYRELLALDDRSLADIGIHRSQIPALVEGFDASRPAPATARAQAAVLQPRHPRLAGGHR
jgi:uncharacterized protein YjiS (DUF1127 family)